MKERKRSEREREKRLVIICVGLLLLLHYLFECNKYQYPQRSPVIQFRCCYYYCHCHLLLLLLNAEEKETAETKMITFPIYFYFLLFFSNSFLNLFINMHTTQVNAMKCKAWYYFLFFDVLILNSQKLHLDKFFLIIMSTMNCL